MGGGDFCAVVGCSNSRRYPERYIVKPHVYEIKFHSAPEYAFAVWESLINRANFKLTTHTRVCSNHFVRGHPSDDYPYPTLYLKGYGESDYPKNVLKRKVHTRKVYLDDTVDEAMADQSLPGSETDSETQTMANQEQISSNEIQVQDALPWLPEPIEIAPIKDEETNDVSLNEAISSMLNQQKLRDGVIHENNDSNNQRVENIESAKSNNWGVIVIAPENGDSNRAPENGIVPNKNNSLVSLLTPGLLKTPDNSRSRSIVMNRFERPIQLSKITRIIGSPAKSTTSVSKVPSKMLPASHKVLQIVKQVSSSAQMLPSNARIIMQNAQSKIPNSITVSSVSTSQVSESTQNLSPSTQVMVQSTPSLLPIRAIPLSSGQSFNMSTSSTIPTITQVSPSTTQPVISTSTGERRIIRLVSTRTEVKPSKDNTKYSKDNMKCKIVKVDGVKKIMVSQQQPLSVYKKPHKITQIGDQESSSSKSDSVNSRKCVKEEVEDRSSEDDKLNEITSISDSSAILEAKVKKRKVKSSIPFMESESDIDDYISYCDAVYSLMQKHGATKLKQERKPQPKQPFQCSMCPRRYPNAATRDAHTATHWCRFCNKSFARSASRIRHEAEVHTQKKCHECQVCGKVFAADSSRRRHEDLIHNQVKNFECMECGKKFGLLQYLEQHIRIHTGEKPYSCDFCNAAFSHNQHLRNHLLTHSDVRQHQCPKCDKAYKRPDKLRNHLKKHENDKAHRCRKCRASYDTEQELDAHLIVHERGPRTCKKCGKTFKDPYYLPRHVCGVEKRGRPPKTQKLDEEEEVEDSDKSDDTDENDVIYDVTNSKRDSLRRRSVRVRKKPRYRDDYDDGESLSEDENSKIKKNSKKTNSKSVKSSKMIVENEQETSDSDWSVDEPMEFQDCDNEENDTKSDVRKKVRLKEVKIVLEKIQLEVKNTNNSDWEMEEPMKESENESNSEPDIKETEDGVNINISEQNLINIEISDTAI